MEYCNTPDRSTVCSLAQVVFRRPIRDFIHMVEEAYNKSRKSYYVQCGMEPKLLHQVQKISKINFFESEEKGVGQPRRCETCSNCTVFHGNGGENSERAREA